MKRYLPFLLAIAIVGCGDDTGSQNACIDTCKDANTVNFCQKDGTTIEQICPFGCDNGNCKEASSCMNVCKDAKTLLKCTDSGQIEEICTNGCENNACKEAPACTESCKDAKTLLKCTDSGQIEEICTNGCENNACKEAPACTESCKDANTLLKCTDSGQIEEICTNGCENNACKEAPACVESCKDAKTLLKCTDSGQIEEICTNGCENNACKEAPACKVSCKDAKTLVLCNDDGTTFEKTCVEGCENDSCTTSFSEAPTSCSKNADAKCSSATTGYICSDWWNMEGGSDLFIQHCAGNRSCIDGDCLVTDLNQCESDYCKDADTLVECKNGTPTEKSCGTGKLCVERACRDSQIKTCKTDSDCADTETCYQNLCYLKTNMAMKVGDECDSSTFQEYCKGDVEYKCGYENTVETNDCSEYNGCSTYVKQAYKTKTPIFNANCRGTTLNLSACTQPGIVLNRCYNVEDDYMPIHYSVASVCVRGSDGRMLYLTDSEETNCGDTACNEATGFCK